MVVHLRVPVFQILEGSGFRFHHTQEFTGKTLPPLVSRDEVASKPGPFEIKRVRHPEMQRLAHPPRQLNTWLALTPCARATRATDAPASSVCSTIRRFSSTERRRRGGTLLTTTCSEVSTYPPSGHNCKCPPGSSSSTPHQLSTRPQDDAYSHRDSRRGKMCEEKSVGRRCIPS